MALYKWIYPLMRILSGMVFVFSGSVKCLDPLGSAYKITDYLVAFGWEALSGLALPAGILLSVTELTLGLCLIAGFRMRFVRSVLLGFVLFFTLLTLYIALTNPVSDCGCFGDALKLTNWQTFYKNVVLLLFSVSLFLMYPLFSETSRAGKEWLRVAACSIFGVLLCLFALVFLPPVDFLPYHPGADLAKSMEVPEGSPPDEYETVFVYEKNGIEKVFSETDYPWDDSTWTWKKTEVKLIKKGFQPPVYDFQILDEEGLDYVDEMLENKGFTFLIAAWNIEGIRSGNREKLAALQSFCDAGGHAFYLLTGSSSQEINRFRAIHRWEEPVFFTDPIQLKTMVRANPGVVLIKEGVVVRKWNLNTFRLPDDGMAMLSAWIQKEMRFRESVFLMICGMLLILLIFPGILKNDKPGRIQKNRTRDSSF